MQDGGTALGLSWATGGKRLVAALLAVVLVASLLFTLALSSPVNDVAAAEHQEIAQDDGEMLLAGNSWSFRTFRFLPMGNSWS